VERAGVRLLILSFYYRPDLCAGSFRATALVEALRERAPAGTLIDVVTTLPNRYRSFAPEAPRTETLDGCEIFRVRLPPHRSGMLGQSHAFGHFALGALTHVAGRKYDLVCATSSRLMTAALGAWIARRKRARLYLDIRDIFVDTLPQLLPPPLSVAAHAWLSRIEAWTVMRAARINLVSPPFADYYRGRYGELPFAFFTNGIDEEFLAPPPPPTPRSGVPTILYAGNIGAGQGLHEILPQLAVALRGSARIVVIGDGGRRSALTEALARAGADNVELRPPMPRERLIEAYRAADVLFLHLGRYAAFEKVLPSKVFEYAALGKPLLAGVAGFAAQFIRAEIDNAAVFPPADAAAAVQALRSLTLTDRPRPAFVARYARSHIVRAMADDILSVAGGSKTMIHA
jgi:glycosyltransferase involved in cell wall biosynthesis